MIPAGTVLGDPRLPVGDISAPDTTATGLKVVRRGPPLPQICFFTYLSDSCVFTFFYVGLSSPNILDLNPE